MRKGSLAAWQGRRVFFRSPGPGVEVFLGKSFFFSQTFSKKTENIEDDTKGVSK